MKINVVPRNMASVALLTTAVTIAPVILPSAAEARDEAAYAEYNDCKKYYRQKMVYTRLGGDWSRYSRMYEWIWHEKCKGIMVGKW